MKKIIFLFFVTMLVMSNVECSSPRNIQPKFNDKLLGYWERVGDEFSGLIIQVQQISNEDTYIGKVVKVPENRRKLIITNEIFWQNVKSISPTHWQGNVLKRYYREGLLFDKKKQTSMQDAKFILVNDNLLEIYTSETQKWIRTKAIP